MTRLICATVLMSTLLAVGCDDSAIPPEVLEQANKTAEPAPKIPTTQEILTGPRTELVLGSLPLTANVPASWKIMRPDKTNVTLLSGYAPSGEIQIQLTARPSLKPDELTALVASAKKEMTQKPYIKKVELHDRNDMKLYERQTVGDPRPYTMYDIDGQPHTTTELIFSWTVIAYVPFEGALQAYELNFIGLTKSQYDQDKELLGQIIDSIRSAAGGPSRSERARPTTLPAPLIP